MQKYLYKDLYELENSHWWHIAKRKLVSSFIRSFRSDKSLKILDIGCGTGSNINELKKFGKTFGIDSSQEAIKFCRNKRLQNIKVASSYKTGYKNDYFDVVTLLDVLEHTDDKKTLNETRRILKKGGYLILTVPAYQWLWSKWDEVLKHKKRYSIESLTKTLKSNGFDIVKISYLYSFLILPVFLVRITKSIFYKSYYPSDFRLSNKMINFIMLKMASLEQKIFFKYGIPFGTTVACLAIKK